MLSYFQLLNNIFEQIRMMLQQKLGMRDTTLSHKYTDVIESVNKSINDTNVNQYKLFITTLDRKQEHGYFFIIYIKRENITYLPRKQFQRALFWSASAEPGSENIFASNFVTFFLSDSTLLYIKIQT